MVYCKTLVLTLYSIGVHAWFIAKTWFSHCIVSVYMHGSLQKLGFPIV